MSWADLGEWWIAEVGEDPAYEQVVTPLLLELLRPELGARYLDLGVGEGRVARTVTTAGAEVVGVDLNRDLARSAGGGSSVVVGELPDLGFLRLDSFDGAYCVLVLEHIPDHAALFASVARVVRPGGVLVVVANHPVWTAPGSTPITDETGEVLWRPGEYFTIGESREPAGSELVTFHHRPLGELLTVAAAVGWSLELMTEQPHHELSDQPGIPRLLGCRWRLLA